MQDLHSEVVPFRDLPDPKNQWELLDKIGVGTYGTVYKACKKDTGQEVAVKVLDSVDEILDEVEQEYIVLRDLSNHDNIPRFYGLFLREDPKQDQLWVIMELCSGGSITELVKTRLQRGHKMEEFVIAHILKETMKGLQHLHEHHVIHRDVKGHNILLTEEGHVKLIDFGVSRQVKNTQDRCCTSLGTPFWMAPEVIACQQQNDTNYDIRCDIWSLGVTAIELADGDPPLANLHPMRALFKIPRDPAPSVRKKENWSKNFLHFIDRCLQKDFEKRPYLSELFSYPFITQVPQNTTKLKSTLQDLIRKSKGRIHRPQMSVKHGQLRMRYQTDSGVDDLATLEALDKGTIVNHLERRYNNSIIYTYIGDILLAVNPFTPLTIYTEQYSRQYRHSAKADHPPHIFAMADQTYQAMVHGRCNQCIVISGESGAGKTESANFMVQQLTQLGRAPNRDLEERILQVNPLMEAFGNAKTVINNNSSRFGKYLEMTFTGSGKVTGARLSEYLLERSRVVNHAKGETNFHVFYYLYDGLVGSEKAGRYYLTDKVNYRYLGSNRGQGCTVDLSTASVSKTKCKTIQRCFEIIGFRTQEVSAIFSILSAILHIGNIDFLEKEVKHQTTTVIGDTNLIQIVAELLGVDARELRVSLTTSSMVARGEMIVRHNSVMECVDCRDALSKAIYGRLFSWLVNQVNDLLRPSHCKEDSSSTENLTVGILDIFGFENFERNSFEQLCINIANEQIQYYFNQHVFAWEQQEYKNEDVDATEIKFVDNRPVLDMFLSKPMGLLALLDEESNFPKATDLTLVEKFGQNITSGSFSRPKSQGLVFTVQHYAGSVEYSAAGLLEKNRDRLAPEVMNMLRLSQIALVRTLFCCSITKTGNLASGSDSNGGSSTSSFSSTISIRSASNVHASATSQARIQQTVATYFRYSLMDLLSKMVAGVPHFVRCIRPNTENSPGYFDSEKVEVQLKYTGVLETTHIRRLGFSHRIPYPEFLRRYAILGRNISQDLPPNKETCKQLLKEIGLENWALGNTKVFLKYYHVDQLCQLFEAKQQCVIRAQSVVRMKQQRKRFLQYKDRLYTSVVIIQKVHRGYLVRRQLKELRERHTKAAVLVQKIIRGFLQRRSYQIRRQVMQHSASVIQRGLRGWLARQKLRRLKVAQEGGRTKAATVIQTAVRVWQARCKCRALEEKRVQYTAQMAKFMKQVRLSAAKVYLLTSKHQPRTKAVTKPKPVPNSDQLMFWPGIDKQANGRVTTQTTDVPVRPLQLSKFVSPVMVHRQSDQMDGPDYTSRVKLSDDRVEQIKKAHDVKTPWTEKDAVYYDSISQDSNEEKCLWTEAKSKANKVNSEKQTLCNTFLTNSASSNGEIKEGGGIWDAPLQVAKEKAIHDLSQQERELELQRELAEVDEMFRSVLAASVASKFLGSHATVTTETNLPAAPPSGLHKTMSEHSLAWDAVLEQAKKTALAPGTKALDDSEDSDSVDGKVDPGERVKDETSAPKLANEQSKGTEEREEKEEQHEETYTKRITSQCDTHHAYNNNITTSQSDDSGDSSTLVKCDCEGSNLDTSAHPTDGTLNFRSLLRKTNYDPKNTLRRLMPSTETVRQTDFRDVLKRKSPESTRDRKANVQYVS